jgi:hypothetical protein
VAAGTAVAAGAAVAGAAGAAVAGAAGAAGAVGVAPQAANKEPVAVTAPIVKNCRREILLDIFFSPILVFFFFTKGWVMNELDCSFIFPEPPFLIKRTFDRSQKKVG